MSLTIKATPESNPTPGKVTQHPITLSPVKLDIHLPTRLHRRANYCTQARVGENVGWRKQETERVSKLLKPQATATRDDSRPVQNDRRESRACPTSDRGPYLYALQTGGQGLRRLKTRASENMNVRMFTPRKQAWSQKEKKNRIYITWKPKKMATRSPRSLPAYDRKNTNTFTEIRAMSSGHSLQCS